MLLDRESAGMDAMTELLLYEASRAQLVRERIRPALAAGRIVLCDRFTDSTVAYQGYGRGLDLDFVARLNALATDGLRPDLTFLLDVDPLVGLRRLRGQHDRIEEEAVAFHERVRAGYRAIATAEPERVRLLDASRPLAEIEADIGRHLEARLRSLPGLPAGSPPCR
jgi:dTMP kinase